MTAATWDEQAKEAVGRSIGQLLDEFTQHPFTHRREHSLHVDLYRLLVDQPELAGMHPIGDTGYKTRLVHKEWPTTVPATFRNSTKRLQSYDLGILAPDDLAALGSIAEFRRGRPPARVAVELSLDYSLDHMRTDLEKFRLNIEEIAEGGRPPSAYLVHFTRVPTGHDAEVRDLIRSTAKSAKINVVYAELDDRKKRARPWHVWRLGASDFEEF